MIAIALAILPPPAVGKRAIALSAELPADESQGLHLGADYPPHITLTQQFVLSDSLQTLLAQLDRVLHDRPPLHLHATGGGHNGKAIWMSIQRSPELMSLHEQLLQVAEPFEVTIGDAAAFADDDARDGDVQWVRNFRREASFDRFMPHITLGHASSPPVIEPLDFVATTIALCQLGRFCTCRRVIHAWELRSA